MAMQKTYANVLGVVLLVLGVWGFIQKPLILSLFGINVYQNILHLIGGALGVWKSGKTFNLWLGWIALIVGILGYVPRASDLLVQIFGINTTISVLHIVVGIVSLGVAYGVKE
ncbi:DUF4383 domain-containing protein [Candidatus Woesearchaeota archaeon]|nr:DUF4383 domain-containing protein [Candidatus Woesearchaeota archaeon]